MPQKPRLSVAVIALHTSPYATPGSGDVGGMNVLVRATVEQMVSAGHRVQVVTRRSSRDEPALRRLSDRLSLRVVDAGPPEPRPKAEHEAFVDEFRAGLDALDEVDVIHSHHWLSGMAALPFARERGIPHVQSYHSIAASAATPLAEGERPESPGRMTGEAWLAKSSDAIVAVSHAEERTILDRLGADPARVGVVLPGVDTQLFRPGRRDGLGRPYVVAAARIEPLKGLDLAVRTIAEIDEADRPDLIIAGGPTAGAEPCLDELRELPDEYGVADRVRFVGPLGRQALARLLGDASAALIPSHSETYGLIALEAAASGTPVLATAAGGLSEAVTEQTGYLLASRRPREWADRLSALLADPVTAQRLAKSAREYALTRSWSRAAHETVEIYRSVLSEPCCAAVHRASA
jgi:D-inositol-3-phosphate glycosyltransferase